MTLSAGTRFGPYEILAPLGAGGMGEVYRARDTKLSREVAIKVLPAELSADRDRLTRFEQEARSASALNHPNIVTIYEIGQADAISYISMELVQGRTLREFLSEGSLPTKRLLALSVQIGDGLARAHEAGIVHRDLKPENLMVTREGFVKILDFGLAKLVETPGSEISQLATTGEPTRPGVVLGTVGYMSPEQATGRPADFRSDQFSLGSILYEMAAGKRAFSRGSAAETLAAIIREEPEPLRSLVPQVPVALRWVIERCLAKDPEERYVSTRDLARDLAHLRDHVSEVSREASPVVARRRHGWLGLGVALATALLLGAALALFAALRLRHELAVRPVRFAIPIPPGLAKLTRPETPSEPLTEAALELDPLSSEINFALGIQFYYWRRYDEAIEQLRRTLELDSNYFFADMILGQAYEQKGQFRESVAAFERARRVTEEAGEAPPEILAGLIRSHALAGNRAAAMKVFEELKKLMSRRYVSRHDLAIVYLALGEKQQALDWLEKAYEDRNWWMPWIKVEPRFDPLRSDPRFADLVGRVGLPP